MKAIDIDYSGTECNSYWLPVLRKQPINGAAITKNMIFGTGQYDKIQAIAFSRKHENGLDSKTDEKCDDFGILLHSANTAV